MDVGIKAEKQMAMILKLLDKYNKAVEVSDQCAERISNFVASLEPEIIEHWEKTTPGAIEELNDMIKFFSVDGDHKIETPIKTEKLGN